MTAKTVEAKRKPVPAKPVAAKPERKLKKDKNGKAQAKLRVVRDSFTMPQDDYVKIAELKQVLLKFGIHAKKSELLRAGLHALSKLSALQLKQVLARIEQIKTGRPKKS